MFISELILFLFSPSKPTFQDKVHLEIWYVTTLIVSSLSFIWIVKNWYVAEKYFFGLIFILYLLNHYWDYL